jgi:hypothetical protein
VLFFFFLRVLRGCQFLTLIFGFPILNQNFTVWYTQAINNSSAKMDGSGRRRIQSGLDFYSALYNHFCDPPRAGSPKKKFQAMPEI